MILTFLRGDILMLALLISLIAVNVVSLVSSADSSSVFSTRAIRGASASRVENWIFASSLSPVFIIGEPLSS